MHTCETAFECFLRSRRVYLSEYKFSTDFAGLDKLRIPKAIAKHPESLESLQIFETLSGLIAQKTLNKPEQLENAQHKKEMLETLKTQHNYKKQRTFKKQRNCIIRKTALPPTAGRDVPQKPLHLGVSPAVTLPPGQARRPPGPARPGPARR